MMYRTRKENLGFLRKLFIPLCFMVIYGLVPFSAKAQVSWNVNDLTPPFVCTTTRLPDVTNLCSDCSTGVCTAFAGRLRQTIHADMGSIKMVRGEWIAACGRDSATGEHRMNYRSLAGLITVQAEMTHNISGAAVPPGTVRLVGDVTEVGLTTNTDLSNAFRNRLNNSYIFACDSPRDFLTSSGGNIPPTALGRGTGELGNPHCPPLCAYTSTPPVRKYKVVFKRSDCLAPSNPNRDCDIPEGYYSVIYNSNGLNGRLAPPSAPRVLRVDGSYGNPLTRPLPYGRAQGLSVADGGVGYEYWALNDFVNMPPPPPPAPQTFACGGTCPDIANRPPVWPFVEGERVHPNAEDISPEMYMLGSFSAESRRSGTTPVLSLLYAGATPYPLFIGPDPGAIPLNGVGPRVNRFPGAYGNGTNVPLVSTTKTAPWLDSPGPNNLMRITALNIPRRVSDNSIPRNIPLAPNQLDNVFNVLKAGYAPWDIVSGMAGNQCSLLKAGAEMLRNSPNNVNRRKNLIYVGGCTTNWGPNTRYAGQDVNWHAFSNRNGAGAPGETDPTNLKLRAVNTDRTINLASATESCFRDVSTQVDSLFVMTSETCPHLASTATANIANAAACSGSCKLGNGAGADNVSDCTARLLYCLTGASREVTKN